MKRTCYKLIALSFSASLLVACSTSDVATGIGAGTGAGLGYLASGGDPAVTAISAGAGAIVGKKIGEDQEDREVYYY